MRDVVAGLFGEYAATLTPDRRIIFDRYHLVDLAYRIVGVGSVGTRCMVALFRGDGDDDPLFLQMKEAGRSVLEPFARKCPYPNQGERVVQGQRIIQASSDVFLGWKRSGGHDYYVRQLKDMKGTVDIAELHPTVMVLFAGLCGLTLAQAHARSGDVCQIAGYLGESDQLRCRRRGIRAVVCGSGRARPPVARRCSPRRSSPRRARPALSARHTGCGVMPPLPRWRRVVPWWRRRNASPTSRSPSASA